MDRLFSKFQLGEIKVGEESNFPPDAEPFGEQQAVARPPAAAEDQLTEQRPASAGERTYRPGYGQGVPEQRGEVLKVSSRSRPSAVAGAIAGVVRESGRAEVQAIGAGAANQAIKAVAIARDYLIETGIEAICLPSLIDLQIDDADRTAIRLVVETR
jgi:stage V sporulation protein S